MTYEIVRDQLAREFGWTFPEIDGMSFDQIYSALTGGKTRKGIPVSSPEEVMRINRNWRKWLA